MTTLATWNVGNRSDNWVARGLVTLVKRHGVDVMGLQECGDRKHVLEEFCRRAGWNAWYGDGSPGAASVPILWNPRTVRALVTGTTDATPSTHVGQAGAGPSKMKPKVWNRVRFGAGEHRGPFVFINGHVVPSVYLPPRRRLARRHIAVLAEMVERRKGRVPVIAVGDFNMRPTDSLTKPLRQLGMTQRTKAPTHGRRTIDHVWTLGVTGHAEVVDMPSDHRAVLFTTA